MDAPSLTDNPRRDLKRAFDEFRCRHDMFTVFSDFVEVLALDISNSCDQSQINEREARYKAVIGKYSDDETSRLGMMLALLACALEQPSDVLGDLMMELELADSWKGQFFTPMSVCDTMAAITLQDADSVIAQRGFFTINDPTVGAGAALIGAIRHLRKHGINPQRQAVFYGQDIDIRACHMAYIQLSLLGVPAVITHGDTLTTQTRSVWVSPMYVLGGWHRRIVQAE